MTISLIAAIAKNNVIGKDNQLIWHMPADMKFFKETTTGHCILTGRKNYESIPEKFRPLANRTNIIVTRNANYNAPGAIVVATIEEGIELARKKNETELFIIGGAEIFKQTINKANKLYITLIDEDFEGDVYFPKIFSEWKETSRTNFKADEKNKYDYSFLVFEK